VTHLADEDTGCTSKGIVVAEESRGSFTKWRFSLAKENVWLKKEIGEYDDEKCHLICYLNFHGLLGNLSAGVCVYISLV
jgi:hypothetical protein